MLIFTCSFQMVSPGLTIEQGVLWNEIRVTLSGLGGTQVRMLVVEHNSAQEPIDICLYDSKCYLNQEELTQGFFPYPSCRATHPLHTGPFSSITFRILYS